MNKKYSDRAKEKVIEQYLAGVSVSDLVSKFNVSRTTVYTWTQDHKKKQKHEAVDMKKHKELQHRCERLEKFIKILQDAPFTKSASLDEKIMYIDSQISEEYTVNLLCEALQISKATYYNRKLRGKNGKTENQKRCEELLPIIREIYHESGQIYGVGKIAAIMKDRGHKITERVVASIMHENDMFSMRNCAKTLYLMNQERKENILNDLARCHITWRVMINHQKTKEIRNHRRLAIISDFSLLAPPAGLARRKQLITVFNERSA